MKKITLLLTLVLLYSAVSLYAQSAQTRLENGKQQFDQGNYDAAIQEFTEVIKRNSKMAEAYARRAHAYNYNGNYDRALDDVNKAIQLDSKLALGYFVRAYVYVKRNDNDRAIADYTEAIKLDPQYVVAYSNRGNVYYNKKDYDHAIMDTTEAIRLNPQYANAYLIRGYAYKDKGDYNRAVTDLNEALRINPNNELAKNGLAEVQKKLAQEEAKRKKEEANKYNPSNFTVVPSDFNPVDYTSVDLFKAASEARNLQIAKNREEAIFTQMQSEFMLGMGGSWFLQYVSDVTFVSQNGLDIQFSSDDKAISQMMNIDQRSGLKPGQKVRVYYTIMRSPMTRWDVVAIERR